jgi:hypothetical protein
MMRYITLQLGDVMKKWKIIICVLMIMMIGVLSGCTQEKNISLHNGAVYISGDTNSALDNEFTIEIYESGNYTIKIDSDVVFDGYINGVRKFVYPMPTWGRASTIEVIKDGISETADVCN